MERTTSQRVLTAVAVLELLEALFELIFAVLGIWALAGTLNGGGSQLPELVADVVGSTTLSGVDATTAVVVVCMLSIYLAAIDALLGVLSLRAAYNPQKVRPVWILSLVSLVLGVGSVVWLLVGGLQGDESFLEQLLGLAFDAVAFWAANDIRKLTLA